MSRVLVEARCRRQGHLLARVVADHAGPQIELVAQAAGVPDRRPAALGRPGHIVRGRGSSWREPFDPAMSYVAFCVCKGGHQVIGAALQNAIARGEPTVLVIPTL